MINKNFNLMGNKKLKIENLFKIIKNMIKIF